MPEATIEGVEPEQEALQLIETEQERLDRDGIYGEIKRELIKRGIPPNEIAFIHDFKTPAEKAQAFADANAGKIRVMIASTEKAGAGTNMQGRLAALHHLDGPWRPSDVEQRNGRILRPMNMFDAVDIFIYITTESFDVYVWQTLESKAKFIAQIMSGNVTARTAEDVDEMVMTAAQVKAIASGNPKILEKVSTELELSRLCRLYTVWRNSRRDLRWELQSLPKQLGEVGLWVASVKQAIAVRDRHKEQKGEAFAIELNHSLKNDRRVTFNKRAQAGEHFEKLHRQAESVLSYEYQSLGLYRGLEICAYRRPSQIKGLFKSVEGFLRLPGGEFRCGFNFSNSGQASLQSIDAAFRSLEPALEKALRDQTDLEDRRRQVERALSSGWEYAGKYEEFRAKLREVNRALRESGSDIGDKQLFAALDPEAFEQYEGDEASAEAAKELPAAEPPAAPPEVPAASIETQPPVLTKQSKPEADVISEDRPNIPIVTLDEPQRQFSQEVKRRSGSSTPKDTEAKQRSLF